MDNDLDLAALRGFRSVLREGSFSAAALALRACRAALLAEFPDAVIEAEQREISAQEGTETAAVTYIFTANIAAPP